MSLSRELGELGELGELREMRKRNHNFSDSLVIFIYRVLLMSFPLYIGVDKTHDHLTCHQWSWGRR